MFEQNEPPEAAHTGLRRIFFIIELMCDDPGRRDRPAVSIEGCRPEEPTIMLIVRLGQRSRRSGKKVRTNCSALGLAPNHPGDTVDKMSPI